MLFLNLCMILETTHTPQGDGNFHSQNRISAECSRNNPHPARGRKPVINRSVRDKIRKQPTPRKGTETPYSPVSLQRSCETTHTPQGDGNRSYASTSPLLSRNNPHPARGRKLPLLVGVEVALRNNPRPARGRKPLIARGGGSALTETTHTPQGDGNAEALLHHQADIETTHTPQGDGNSGFSFGSPAL